MKRIIFLLILILTALVVPLTALAQSSGKRHSPEEKFTPNLHMLISGDPDLERTARRNLHIKTGHPFKEPMVDAFIRFQGDPKVFEQQYGVRIRTVVGNVATVDIPVSQLKFLAGHQDIIRIEESRKLRPNLEISVPETGANALWGSSSNRPLPPPWSGNTGKNAIIGIVDTGIDLSHNDFKDSTGKSRVLFLWDQTNAHGTTPPNFTPPTPPPPTNRPPQFPYGTECTKQQIDGINEKTDLAVMNQGDNTLSIFMGAGGGSFGSATNYAIGNRASSVAMGDFNKDGHLDLAVTNSNDSTISILLGNGSGTFTPAANVAVAAGLQPVSIAVEDFNRDGNLDLVMPIWNGNQIAVLLGNGDGTFGAPAYFSVGNNPDAVVVSDFDNDGKPDLAVTNSNDGTVSILLGNGDGTFKPAVNFPAANASVYSSGPFPIRLATGDFNGDGLVDLVVTINGRVGLWNDPITILLGNGNGTFQAPMALNQIPTPFLDMVVVADFNGDGKLDLAAAGYGSSGLVIYLGNGDGTFGSPLTYPVQDISAGLIDPILTAGDFNGDGILDLAVTEDVDNTVSILLGNGDGTFTFGPQPPVNIGLQPPSYAHTAMAVGKTPKAIVAGNFHGMICSEVDVRGHGTHVAGIAAGNGSDKGFTKQSPYNFIGMAPEANLIIVKSTLNTSDIVDGVAYIENRAASIGLPVVINLSIASQDGPHDGTGDFETALDGLTGFQKVIVVSAGNDAQKNIHASGHVVNGQKEFIGLNMPATLANGNKDLVLDIWYSGSDQIGVNLDGPLATCLNISPGGFLYPGHAPVALNTTCGMVTIWTNAINSVNGDHEISIDFNFDVSNPNPIVSGPWTITLAGAGCGNGLLPCITNGSFDIWAWSYDGTFADHIDPFKTVGIPGTATNVITVGSYVTKNVWNTLFTTTPATQASAPSLKMGDISSFSSLGPRRKCTLATNPTCTASVQKPELAAPGEEIMSSYAPFTETTYACNDSTFFGQCLGPDGKHIVMQGTSMAAPHVTGAAALMLSQYPNVTSDQIKNALENARNDSYTQNLTYGLTPNDTWGFGKLAVDLAIASIAPPVIVPNVIGLPQGSATAAITAANLVLGAVTQANSTTVPIGNVISQNPAAGSSVSQGSAVGLVVSKGTSVPNVIGLAQSIAQGMIIAANLVVGNVAQTGSLIVQKGVVISQSPAPGSSLALGSAIDLVVSCGTNVPNVVGLNQISAQSAIIGANLVVGLITQSSSLTIPVGEIISQNPVFGLCLPQGSSIDLVVSSGTIVPDVVGLGQSSAQSVIIGSNLVVGSVTFAFNLIVPIGSVISESPSGGTSIAQGSSVDLVISSGPLAFIVPNVVGMTQANAQSTITGALLTVGIVTQSSSLTVAAGNVISQTPAAGSSVAQGSAVALVVSSGPPGVLVPNVVGMTQANAQSAITGVFLTVGNVTQSSSLTVLAGNVISQTPAAGSSVAQGSAVALVVSTGPPQVLVPNVVGLTQANAQGAITGALLTVGIVTQSSSMTVAAGNVISQNPAAGSSVAQGSAVSLVVSSGPPAVLVPNVVGLTQANAQGAITGALLTVGIVTQSSSMTVATGNVISQSPAAGASVLQGSAVALVVSTGSGPVNLTSSVTITRSGFVFNRLTNTFDSVVSITNSSTTLITGSPVLVISNISPTTVNLANAAGINSSGNSYVNLPIPSGGWAPGQTITNVLLKFNDPSRVSFTFATSVFSAP